MSQEIIDRNRLILRRHSYFSDGGKGSSFKQLVFGSQTDAGFLSVSSVQNPGWLMISSGTILPFIYWGFCYNPRTGNPVLNQPLYFME